jgi:hypothetical protein
MKGAEVKLGVASVTRRQRARILPQNQDLWWFFDRARAMRERVVLTGKVETSKQKLEALVPSVGS